MLPRHAISDADWDRIQHLLPGRPGQTGWLAQDNRRFIDAVLWIAKIKEEQLGFRADYSQNDRKLAGGHRVALLPAKG